MATSDFPDERGLAVADLYGCEVVDFPDLGHFDLVLHPAPRAAAALFLGAPEA